MRKAILVTSLVIGFSLMMFNTTSYAFSGGKKFVGVKSCVMCHKSEKQGEQQKIWEASAHASAYKTLQTAEADELAKKAGLTTKAADSKECLVCHVTAYDADASMLDKKYKVEDGVQCESCHGAGSEYKSMKTMKDHAAAVAAGMTEYKTEADIETHCKTCHNEKSPTFKEFKFAEMWDKIKHPVPGK